MRCSKLIKSVICVSLVSVACLVFLLNFPSVVTPGVEEREVISAQRPWMEAPKARDPCKCHPGTVDFKKEFPKDQYDQVSQRRKGEFEKYQNRTSPELSKVLLALPNSPLQYPIHGVTVKPMKSGLIPGLALHARDRSVYKVTLNVSKGVLSSDDSYRNMTVTGKGGSELTLVSSSLDVLNAALATVSYTSTFYHAHTTDLVSFCFENHEAMFPVVIKQPQLPVLYDMGTDINSQVTIAVKSFIRYDALKVLLHSIRTFYPSMTVIIADDSFEPENITGENILQYIMPPAQGWFAGRNLAASQVTTKYFLWCDDDFLFTKDTKIEKMVEVLEAFPELDVVGGSVAGYSYCSTFEYDEGDDEGGCLFIKHGGKFHALPGYPQCIMVNGVVNFFLARTDSIRKSRFDPLLKRRGHLEWFMDGLGSMMVASCSHVRIWHQPRKHYSDLYRNHRFPNVKSDRTYRSQVHFIKNYLKCLNIE